MIFLSLHVEVLVLENGRTSHAKSPGSPGSGRQGGGRRLQMIGFVLPRSEIQYWGQAASRPDICPTSEWVDPSGAPSLADRSPYGTTTSETERNSSVKGSPAGACRDRSQRSRISAVEDTPISTAEHSVPSMRVTFATSPTSQACSSRDRNITSVPPPDLIRTRSDSTTASCQAVARDGS